MSEDLVTWLRAQIDEDERWLSDWGQLLDDVHLRQEDTVRHQLATSAFGFTQSLAHQYPPPAEPNRMLAEVEAKRRILDLAEEVAAEHERVEQLGPFADIHQGMDPDEYEQLLHGLWMRAQALAEVARLLGPPYAGRDGWREEWRPE